jgi:recombinational DNA repair ATPase RecF
MILSYVNIVNFRSIANARVDFTPTCRALIGINESGKTNILDALGLLDKDTTTNASDIREPLEDEPPIAEAYVRFVFRFTPEERAQIAKLSQEKVLGATPNTPIFKDSKETISSYAASISEGTYKANLVSLVKSSQYWTLTEREIATGWLKPNKSTPATVLIPNATGGTTRLRNSELSGEQGYPTKYHNTANP